MWHKLPQQSFSDCVTFSQYWLWNSLDCHEEWLLHFFIFLFLCENMRLCKRKLAPLFSQSRSLRGNSEEKSAVTAEAAVMEDKCRVGSWMVGLWRLLCVKSISKRGFSLSSSSYSFCQIKPQLSVSTRWPNKVFTVLYHFLLWYYIIYCRRL